MTFSEFYETSLGRFSKRWGELSSGIQEGDVPKKEEANRQFSQELFGEMDRALGNWSKFQQIFIPAGRAFYSHMAASVFRTLEAGQDISGSFLHFFGSFC